MELRLTLMLNQAEELDLLLRIRSNMTIGEVAHCLEPLLTASQALTTLQNKETELTLAFFQEGEHPEGVKDSQIQIIDPKINTFDLALASGVKVAIVPAFHYRSQKAALLEIEGRTTKKLTLSDGLSTVGRSPENTVVILDPMISKKHARIFVDNKNIWLIDEGSANGILLAGTRVDRVNLATKKRAVIGETTLKARFIAPPKQQIGWWQENVYMRGFHPGIPDFPGKVIAVEVPEKLKDEGFSWVTVTVSLAAPILLGVVLFFVTGRVSSLIFLLFSPIMLFSGALSRRILKNKKLKKERNDFELYLNDLKRQVQNRNKKQKYYIASKNFIAKECVNALKESRDINEGESPRIWWVDFESEEFMSVCVGTGRVRSNTVLEMPEKLNKLCQQHFIAAQKLKDSLKFIKGAKVNWSLKQTPIIGVSGEKENLHGFLRALLTQLTSKISPENLLLAAIMNETSASEFDSLKWLPHVKKAEQTFGAAPLTVTETDTRGLLTALNEHLNSKAARPVLLLIGEGAPIDPHALLALSKKVTPDNFFIVFFSRSSDPVPSFCSAHLKLQPGGAAIFAIKRSNTQATNPTLNLPKTLNAEYLDGEQFSSYCRSLARFKDAFESKSRTAEVPRSIPLLHVIGRQTASDTPAVEERWAENAAAFFSGVSPSLRANVGVANTGIVSLDLLAQGPHALIGGTTGSGKSEFLQTWMLSLATEYSPQILNLLFIDYKGGAAFSDCTNLPHSVGIVTDLDKRLAKRVLVSLRAEIKLREEILLQNGAKDLVTLHKHAPKIDLPFLIIVVDEFATLLEEVPEFVDGMVDIAQRGRSLGIHLILATQRPNGVIRGSLRANMNLRVALRVADEADSLDILGDKTASLFAVDRPGQAAFKFGSNGSQVFQSAYANSYSYFDVDGQPPEVFGFKFGSRPQLLLSTEIKEKSELTALSPSGLEARLESNAGFNDLRRVVNNINKANLLAGFNSPRKPWLAELPETLDLEELQMGGRGVLPFGMRDIPEQQKQETIHFDFVRDKHLLVIGAPGSGKSTLLRTLAGSALRSFAVHPVHVYCLDFSLNGLQNLDSLVNVGALFGQHMSPHKHAEGTRKTILFLEAEIQRRKQLLVTDGVEILRNEPYLVLMMDGFNEFRKKYEGVPGRRGVYETFLRVWREGSDLGVHCALTADTSSAFRIGSGVSLGKKVFLRLLEEEKHLLNRSAVSVLNDDGVPGRCVVDGYECQIALASLEHLRELDTEAYARAGAELDVRRVGVLSDKLRFSDLPMDAAGQAVLGRFVDTGKPVSFVPSGVFLLVSKRQQEVSALSCVAKALSRFDPAFKKVLLNPLKNHIEGTWDEEICGATEVLNYLEAFEGDFLPSTRVAIFVANLQDLLRPPVFTPLTEKVLDRLVFLANDKNLFLMVQGDPQSLQQNFGIVGRLKAAQRGLSFSFARGDGELIFKSAFPETHEPDIAPDRCLFSAAGVTETVQLPSL